MPGDRRSRGLFLAAALCAVGWFGPAITDRVVASPSRAEPLPLHGGEPYRSRPDSDRRYRILGKVRLALVWVSRDVGSARLTLRSEQGGTALTLLAGSDPQRAPRNLNQWTYLREETTPTRAEIFALRSMDERSSGSDTPLAPGRGPSFSVNCASVSGTNATSALTTVQGQGVTYRMFPDLLDRLPASGTWTRRETLQPEGTQPGFLTALQHVLEHQRTTSSVERTSLTYLYNDTLYDLRVHGSKNLGRTQVGARQFDRLTRTDLLIRNRRTSAVTKFAVTHSDESDAAAWPIQIFFQPSFWLGVELRLDNDVDAPEEPTLDARTLARVRGICGGAGVAWSPD